MLTTYQYIVIGAGPAGINAVTKILKKGTSSQEILWIDPSFTTGDFGTKYKSIPGNTKVSDYLPCFNAWQAIFDSVLEKGKYEKLFAAYSSALKLFKKLNADYTCPLGKAAAPMWAATNLLKQLIETKTSKVKQLKVENQSWKVECEDGICAYARHVILAIGAEPKKLSLFCPINHLINIPLENISSISPGATVGVIGSSHSAALAVMQLLEAKSKAIWFKRNADKPCRYAQAVSDEKGSYVLYDNTGLKGEVAAFHRSLEAAGNTTEDLIITESCDESFQRYFPNCTHVVHAVGFQARGIPIIFEDSCICSSKIEYDHNTGLAKNYPGLLLLGISHPIVLDEYAGRRGPNETLMAGAVGVNKFFATLKPEIFTMLEKSWLIFAGIAENQAGNNDAA